MCGKQTTFEFYMCDCCNFSLNFNFNNYISTTPRKVKNHKKKYFIFAKIVSRNFKPLSFGFNSYKRGSALQARFAKRCGFADKLYTHAEVDAIRKLRPNQLEKAYAILVYRFDGNGNPALAKPCKVCQSVIKAAGIKKIYYTTSEDSLDMDYQQYKQYNDKYADLWL